MLFSRHLLLATVRGLLEDTNLPSGAAQPRSRCYGEHSLRSRACSYPDSVTSYRSNTDCRTAGRNKQQQDLRISSLRKKTKKTNTKWHGCSPIQTAWLCGNKLVSLLLQIHWRLDFRHKLLQPTWVCMNILFTYQLPVYFI